MHFDIELNGIFNYKIRLKNPKNTLLAATFGAGKLPEGHLAGIFQGFRLFSDREKFTLINQKMRKKLTFFAAHFDEITPRVSLWSGG